MAPITVADLLSRNAHHAATHIPLPNFPEFEAAGLNAPSMIIVSCADPRVVPENIFGLKPGDSVIMRCIAGHPQRVFNDILALDAVFSMKDLVVLHHTDCGATYFTEEGVKTELKKRGNKEEEVDGMQFGAISTSLEQSVVDDLEFLKTSLYIRKELAERTRGFLYDIKTGKVREIEA